MISHCFDVFNALGNHSLSSYCGIGDFLEFNDFIMNVYDARSIVKARMAEELSPSSQSVCKELDEIRLYSLKENVYNTTHFFRC